MRDKPDVFIPTNPDAYNRLFERFCVELDLLYKEVYGCNPDKDYFLAANLEQLGKEADELGKRLKIYYNDHL